MLSVRINSARGAAGSRYCGRDDCVFASGMAVPSERSTGIVEQNVAFIKALASDYIESK